MGVVRQCADSALFSLLYLEVASCDINLMSRNTNRADELMNRRFCSISAEIYY